MTDTTFDYLETFGIIQVKDKIRQYAEPEIKRYTSGIMGAYQDVFISGGCIASLLQGEEPNDFDVYFRSIGIQKAVLDFVKMNHADEIEDYSVKYRDANAATLGKVITENATTMKNKIQFITRKSGTPEEVRESFDFVHCTPWYDVSTNMLYISREQYDLCVTKKLKVKNAGSLKGYRTQKFINRGYTWLINPDLGQIQD
jgi:hypothetical protein